ncbi:MAG TPA: DUF2202 domain-containing protein [Kineosporiaceae bacterium]|nr:DUF2202 domain-containing protein [Kineosporiaceae bacterium]
MRRSVTIAAAATAATLSAGLLAVPAFGLAATSITSPTPRQSATGTAGCPYGVTDPDGQGRGWGTAGGRGGPGMMGGPGRMGGPGMVGGPGMMSGDGTGPGMMGRRADGTVADPLAGLAQGSLTADQKVKLAGLAEEEKLAHDVYVALAASTKDTRFTRIAAAESWHLTMVRALLTRYGISDPTAGRPDGSFASAQVQQQYRDLVARGSASADAALAVGRDVENADLAALSGAGAGVSAQDVTTVYARLDRASRMHLRAFGS